MYISYSFDIFNYSFHKLCFYYLIIIKTQFIINCPKNSFFVSILQSITRKVYYRD